jgi:hypothetical protein
VWLSARVLAAALAFALTAAPASAHDAFGTMGPFWFGALHIAVSAMSLAILIGLGATLQKAEKEFVFPAQLIAIAAAGAASLSGQTLTTFGAIGAIALGLTAAFAVRLPMWSAYAIAIVGGLCAGIAADVDKPSLAAAVGVAFSVFMLGGLSYALFDTIETRAPFARRIAGAWVAAIGCLVAALMIARA